MNAMVLSAKYVAKNMQGFKIAYVQSDEVTFCLTDYDNINTQGWFNYELPKLISISASLMTVAFNHYLPTDKMPIFDSRAFSVPKKDIVNTFLWRTKDWVRNSLQMYCRSFFSHKELHNKKTKDMHEMLYKIGKNWTTDLTDRQKNGTFILKDGRNLIEISDLIADFQNLNSILCKLI